MNRPRVWHALLVILLIGVLVLGGFSCAAPAPSPAPGTKPPVATSAAPSGPPPGAAPIKITYLGGMPLKTLITDGQEKFKELIEKKSNGVITIDLYPAGQLYLHKDMPEAIQNGAASMAVGDSTQWSGLAPAGMVYAMPLGFDSLKHILRFVEQVNPIFDKELAKINTKLVGLNYYGTGFGIISRKPIQSPADFAGKKLRGMADIHSVVFGALGASMVSMSSAEVYTALERGMLDAAFSGYSTFVSRKWMEPCKYVITGPNFTSFMPTPYPVVWNIDKWKALPAWAQQMVTETVKEVYEWQIAEADKMDTQDIDTMKKNGVTFYLIPEAEWPNWTKGGKVGWNYIAERDKENGAAILKAVDATR